MAMDHEKAFNEMIEREISQVHMVLSRVEKYGEKIAMRHRAHGPWESVTWNQLGEMIRASAMALLDFGIKRGDMVAIYSQNRMEWTISDLGSLAVGAVDATIYATNSAEEAEYIINDAEAKVVFCDGQEQYDRIMSIVGRSQYIRRIVVFDPLTVLQGDISYHFADFLEIGRKSGREQQLQARIDAITPDDIVTLIYTSGTTGVPKGAMHTHRSLFAMNYGTVYVYGDLLHENMVSLCFLPLSHIFERAWTYGILYCGMENNYCHDTKQIVEFFGEVRPHIMCTVPRVWEKVYGTIYDKLESASEGKKKLFNWSTGVAKEAWELKKLGRSKGPLLAMKYAIADKLVLSKLRAIVGGRTVSYNVGGAAFSPELNEFFNSVGIMLGQGYALTEFFPVAISCFPVYKKGTCGPVFPQVQVRLSEEGEIQCRGPVCMQGYYRKEEATKEVLTEDGWFSTGDVGIIDEDGYIKITDRIKDLIITAGGKNIAPQQIELLVGEDIYIEHVAAIGDGRKYISALIVPAFEVLEEYCRNNGITFSSPEELIAKPEIIAFYRERIDKATAGLGRVEQIKKFTLLPKPFSQEDGEITPTMKVRRKVVNQKYNDVIEAMYTGE